MRIVLFLLQLLLLLVIYIPMFAIVWVARKSFDKKRGRSIQFAALLVSLTLARSNPLWRVTISGRENMVKNKPYLIAINHSSYYDIPLVNSLPLNMRWVAKHELLRTPLLGIMLALKGDVMVKRGDPESAKNMVINTLSFLRNGVCVSIFPEGTRSKDGKVAEFKEGAFLVAKKARVAILPMVVKGTYETSGLPKAGLFSRSEFHLEILPEIPVETVKQMGVRELSNYTHDIILKKHKELAPYLYREEL